MADPTTANVLLAVPTRGSDPGTWDIPVNNNTSALDGYFGGVQTISVSNAPITLTAPAGTVTAGGGPTQAQNSVLQFTGALSANVIVTLPLPGYYIVENLTTGNFVLSFRALGSGQVIGVDQGETLHIYNNGTNVRFVNLGRVGHFELWFGINTIPAWVTACTVPPYLICDGTIYNFSTYPYLGAKLSNAFGGNGVTTFGVPDLRGRFPLIYDGTGTRITVANSGINGQTIGAAGGLPDPTIVIGNLPSIPLSVTGNIVVNATSGPYQLNTSGSVAVATGGGGTCPVSNSGTPQSQGVNTLTGTAGGTSTPLITIPPTQVSGIAVIRAA